MQAYELSDQCKSVISSIMCCKSRRQEVAVFQQIAVHTFPTEEIMGELKISILR